MTIYPTNPAWPSLVEDRRFEWIDKIDVNKVMEKLNYQFDTKSCGYFPASNGQVEVLTASWPEHDAVIKHFNLPKKRRFYFKGIKVIGGNPSYPHEENPKLETNRLPVVQFILEVLFKAETFVLYCRWRYRRWKNKWPMEPVIVDLVSIDD